MKTATSTQALDVDLHIEPPKLEELLPYMPETYAEQISDTTGIKTPTFRWYPKPMQSEGPAPSAVEMPDGAHAPIAGRILTCMTGFETVRDPYLAAALASATNNWLASHIAAQPGTWGSLVLPLTNIDAAVDEINRCSRDTFVRVLLPIRSDLPYGNKRYHRIFEACAKKNLVIGLHAWGAGLNPATASGDASYYVEDYMAGSQIAETQITSIISEGVLDLYPTLRISLLECGFAWIAPFLWRLDKDWKGLWREVPWVKRAPSSYFYDHFRVSSNPAHLPKNPAQVRDVLDMLRAREILMFASDHPHTHGAHTALDYAALAHDEADAIVWRNAAAHYEIG